MQAVKNILIVIITAIILLGILGTCNAPSKQERIEREQEKQRLFDRMNRTWEEENRRNGD